MAINQGELYWLKLDQETVAHPYVVIETSEHTSLIFQKQPPQSEPEVVDPNDVVITHSTDIPDEVPPDENYIWYGKESDPKYINLPTISTEGYVLKVGVDQNVEIAVPPNIHFAGWFVDSVRPGDTGLSIIDGHVDGPNLGGIFKNLGSLNPNDEFSIEIGDGTSKKFKVLEVITVNTEDAGKFLFSQNSGVQSQLNLITCTGVYLVDQETYDQRIL